MDPNTFTQEPYSQNSVTETVGFSYLFALYFVLHIRHMRVFWASLSTKTGR